MSNPRKPSVKKLATVPPPPFEALSALEARVVRSLRNMDPQHQWAVDAIAKGFVLDFPYRPTPSLRLIGGSAS